MGQWRIRHELYKLCRERRPTIVHTRNLSGLDALFPSWLAGVPYRVHGEHGWDVDDLRGDRRRPRLLRKLHSPMVDRYVTVSSHLKRYLVERIGIDERRVVHICNGVDDRRFAPGERPARDMLPASFRDADVVVIGTVGRMQPVKDHATLVRAVARVVRETPSIGKRVRLAIAGDGPLLAATRDLASEVGLGDVMWMPGALADVPAFLRGLDVFVLPSLAEGISNTILEAMATGLPVIATSVGGNVELVDDGRTGRFFSAGNIDELASHLAAYVSDPETRRAAGAEARRQAVARFSIDRMIAAYEALYEDLCAAGSLRTA